MDERVKRLIKPMAWIAIIVFIISCLIQKPESLDDFISYVGYAISTDSILFILYERYLWRKIPWNRPPLLKSRYEGTVKYNFDGVRGQKSIKIKIEQSWLSIKILTETDINRSYSITGSIVSENGRDFLYYTYVTNPDAGTQKDNPVQYGTCQIELDGDCSNLRGKYWTTSQTVGDMIWEEAAT